MNEKIKALFIQAGGSIEEENGNLWTYSDDLDPEKFAQLVVRECIDIVEQDMKLAHIQMIPLTLEKYANGRLKEKIKEHFGVTE
jgi:hypothetical protein